jgi:hypothetical protein
MVAGQRRILTGFTISPLAGLPKGASIADLFTGDESIGRLAEKKGEGGFFLRVALSIRRNVGSHELSAPPDGYRNRSSDAMFRYAPCDTPLAVKRHARYHLNNASFSSSRVSNVASRTEVVDHPTPTTKRGLLYQFTPKHHGGARGQATWDPNLSDDEEFAIFNMADETELADVDGNLYGVMRIGVRLRTIGCWSEQVAEFPVHGESERWHGYPCWPLNDEAPDNRKGQKHRPAQTVFQVMLEKGIITKQQRKRLITGDNA